MTRTRLVTLTATAIGLALAGCAKKPPKQLPPPPPSQTAPPSSGYGNGSDGSVSGTAVPGSRADLIAQAGTDTVHFATDSADVDAEGQQTLAKQAAWLRKYPNVRVTIEGHCDERGTREYNLALGDRRGNSAKTYLVNAGITAGRITVISYGKERPVETGSDESAWAANRRAVTVVPN